MTVRATWPSARSVSRFLARCVVPSLATCVALAWPVTARAESPSAVDDLFTHEGSGDLALGVGLAVARPAALPIGLSRGLGVGVERGTTWTYGARASWATATEASEAWLVTHRDLRLRVTGGVQHRAGRGTLGLRLGAGGVLVHEKRTRHQGGRAGLSGDELEMSALALLPGASLEAVVGLHVRGPWMLALSGGPALTVEDGTARVGWIAEVGLGWRR